MTESAEPQELTTRARRANRKKEGAALGIIAVVLLLPVRALLRSPGAPMEEGFMLAFPEQILNGRFPHRDFLHLYGPGSLYVLAGVFAVFGVRLMVERVVGFGQHTGLAFGMYGLLRPFGRTVATSSAVVSVLVLISPGGLSAMAWNGALALAVGALALGTTASRQPDEQRTPVLPVVSGVLAGAALLYRPDMILAVAVGMAAVLWDMPNKRRRPLLIALTATLMLYIPHLIVSGFSESFRGMFLDPVFHLRGGRSLPVPPSWDQIDGFLERAVALHPDGWPLPMPSIPNQIFIWFWLVPISAVLNLIVAWRLRGRDRRDPRSLALWPASLFAIALLPQAMQRPDTTHLAWVSGITFALVIPSVAIALEGRTPRLGQRGRASVAIGAVAVVLLLAIPFFPVHNYADLVARSFSGHETGSAIKNGTRTFYFGDAEAARQAQSIVDTLKKISDPGDSLIVGPSDLSRTNYSDTFFYFLLPDLVPGTRYLELDPGIANRGDSGLADELAHSDWLIEFTSSDQWNEPNKSSDAGAAEPNSIVRTRYCMVIDTGGFRLLRRCR